jgi:hypothetical protein
VAFKVIQKLESKKGAVTWRWRIQKLYNKLTQFVGKPYILTRRSRTQTDCVLDFYNSFLHWILGFILKKRCESTLYHEVSPLYKKAVLSNIP